MGKPVAPLEAVLLGAGNRGRLAYGRFALQHPEKIRFVAVADPCPGRREAFAAEHGIEPARRFCSHEELLARGRLAQALFNCTLDRLHLETTLPALEAGYDVMLEKPVAATAGSCAAILQAARTSGALVAVAHVLRYTPFFSRVHQIIASGRLGQVISAEQRENVAYWHMAHSFVRGNWRSSAEQSPMILAKCCHDLDLLYWNLGPARRLASFGSLLHFQPERAPAGAPERCSDGCPAEARCPFFAPRLYLTEYVGWPVSVIADSMDLASRRRALQSGPYGRCVFRCDNDVVDHQVVSLELERGGSAVLVMHGHSHAEQRTLRYDGTRATLRGRFDPAGRGSIEVHDHLKGRVEHKELGPVEGDAHGGGDAGLVQAFVQLARGGRPADSSDLEQALESHLMAFAAEEARQSGQVVSLETWRDAVIARGRERP